MAARSALRWRVLLVPKEIQGLEATATSLQQVVVSGAQNTSDKWGEALYTGHNNQLFPPTRWASLYREVDLSGRDTARPLAANVIQRGH